MHLPAQEDLVDYYAGYGFESTGERYDDSGVAHQPMMLSAGKLSAIVAARR